MSNLIPAKFNLSNFQNPFTTHQPLTWRQVALGLGVTTATLLTTIYLLPPPPQKSKLRFSASKKINAPASTLYAIVGDYFTGGHASILPPQFCNLIATPIDASSLTVDEITTHVKPPINISFSTSVLGASLQTKAVVYFPSQNKIVETVKEKGLTTSFVFTEEADGWTKVTIESVVEQRGNNVVWWGEQKFWPWAFLPVYKEELGRLEEVVRRQGGDEVNPGGEVEKKETKDKKKSLKERQEEIFKLGEEIVTHTTTVNERLVEGRNDLRVTLSLRPLDVEHCLCELNKYFRYERGEMTKVRLYTGASERVIPEKVIKLADKRKALWAKEVAENAQPSKRQRTASNGTEEFEGRRLTRSMMAAKLASQSVDIA
ncbi:hypothetical protein HK097_001114 [Rhizophlyctis rosea]|uniref:Uncharacterized protein n=1 Tax=Rhizophlyctis rosea TaxID=64517 RepID=A0AAD5S705_9FUNG|nr:hypothetical protein HK097_001114 [Rhizophlyctis rosea]